MDVSATQSAGVQAWEQRRHAERQDHHQRPSEALVESIKSTVKQQDRSLGQEGAEMVAGTIAARHIDVSV
jgi:hypothetical protein